MSVVCAAEYVVSAAMWAGTRTRQPASRRLEMVDACYGFGFARARDECHGPSLEPAPGTRNTPGPNGTTSGRPGK